MLLSLKEQHNSNISGCNMQNETQLPIDKCGFSYLFDKAAWTVKYMFLWLLKIARVTYTISIKN